MAFMRPTADWFSAEEAFECAKHEEGQFDPDSLDPEDYAAGWYGCLSAPGYLDRTQYSGPFASYEEAITHVMEFFEVDENGDDLTDEAA